MNISNKFKEFLLKDVGKRCDDYCWDCFVCRSWRLYDEILAYEKNLEMLDKLNVNGKEIREHTKGRKK